MSRHQISWLIWMVVLTIVAAATAPAFPEVQETPDGAAKAVANAQGDERTVESILLEQEQLRRGQRFNYDPEGRRDPFRSLFAAMSDSERPREEGIRGMGVDDIDLAGIVQDPNGGNLAYFTGSDNKGYFLRVGDRIWDATLLAIDSRRGVVTFRQKTDDPRQIKPYRDVVRRLSPEESSNE